MGEKQQVIGSHSKAEPLEVDVILKLYGFNGNFDVDRLMFLGRRSKWNGRKTMKNFSFFFVSSNKPQEREDDERFLGR